MRPRLILALIALALSLQQLVPWLLEEKQPVPLLSLILLPVAWFLYRGKRFAFRFLRFLFWIGFVFSLLFAMIIIYSNSYDGLYVAHSRTASVFWYIGWTIALGGLLYYTDLERVKLSFSAAQRSS